MHKTWKNNYVQNTNIYLQESHKFMLCDAIVKGHISKKRTHNKRNKLNFNFYCAEDSLKYTAQFLYLIILLFTPRFKRPFPISDLFLYLIIWLFTPHFKCPVPISDLFLYLIILLFIPSSKRPIPISDNFALHPKPRFL